MWSRERPFQTLPDSARALDLRRRGWHTRGEQRTVRPPEWVSRKRCCTGWRGAVGVGTTIGGLNTPVVVACRGCCNRVRQPGHSNDTRLLLAVLGTGRPRQRRLLQCQRLGRLPPCGQMALISPRPHVAETSPVPCLFLVPSGGPHFNRHIWEKGTSPCNLWGRALPIPINPYVCATELAGSRSVRDALDGDSCIRYGHLETYLYFRLDVPEQGESTAVPPFMARRAARLHGLPLTLLKLLLLCSLRRLGSLLCLVGHLWSG